MKFGEYELENQPYPRKGEHYKIFFDNGWGASIIKSGGSYGHESGLYEMAVIRGNEKKWDIHYDNIVADGDVKGWLSPEDVEANLDIIKGFDTSVETKKTEEEQ